MPKSTSYRALPGLSLRARQGTGHCPSFTAENRRSGTPASTAANADNTGRRGEWMRKRVPLQPECSSPHAVPTPDGELGPTTPLLHVVTTPSTKSEEHQTGTKTLSLPSPPNRHRKTPTQTWEKTWGLCPRNLPALQVRHPVTRRGQEVRPAPTGVVTLSRRSSLSDGNM